MSVIVHLVRTFMLVEVLRIDDHIDPATPEPTALYL